jgi:DeoR/GlpR family transcriptional regulator of sugar metabolism
MAAQRRVLIAHELHNNGLAIVANLARRHDVSEMTIRRDLEVLGRSGDLVRVRGGAMLRKQPTAFEPAWDAKVALHSDAKERIGSAAAARVQAGETILIDSGTTALQVARALSVPCSVVVVDVQLAVVLASRPMSDGIHAIMVGGSVRSGFYSTTGHFALEMLNQLHVDRVFLSADAIDAEAGITNATMEETPIKQQMISAGQEVVLVADGSKLGMVAFSRVAGLDQIDLWITDDTADAGELERIRRAGLSVEVV